MLEENDFGFPCSRVEKRNRAFSRQPPPCFSRIDQESAVGFPYLGFMCMPKNDDLVFSRCRIFIHGEMDMRYQESSFLMGKNKRSFFDLPKGLDGFLQPSFFPVTVTEYSLHGTQDVLQLTSSKRSDKISRVNNELTLHLFEKAYGSLDSVAIIMGIRHDADHWRLLLNNYSNGTPSSLSNQSTLSAKIPQGHLPIPSPRKHPHFPDIRGFVQPFGNGFALVKIFDAIPSPLFSATVELRALTLNQCHSSLCSPDSPDRSSFFKVVLNTSSPSDFVRFPRRMVRDG